MINRIRDIRREKNLTLAEVAARCNPATTAQTIGRLETGMRNLSLRWMNRIATAMEVKPELLLRGEETSQPKLIARITADGAEPLSSPRDAILPTVLGSSDDGINAANGAVFALAVEWGAGEYRAGDQIWLRRYDPSEFARLLNRDVLAPRSNGRFAFGRMIDRDGKRVALLPPGSGQRQIIIDNPPWLGLAEILVRKL